MCALQQHFAEAFQVEVVEIELHVVVFAGVQLQRRLDALAFAGSADALAADFEAVCHRYRHAVDVESPPHVAHVEEGPHDAHQAFLKLQHQVAAAGLVFLAPVQFGQCAPLVAVQCQRGALEHRHGAHLELLRFGSEHIGACRRTSAEAKVVEQHVAYAYGVAAQSHLQ